MVSFSSLTLYKASAEAACEKTAHPIVTLTYPRLLSHCSYPSLGYWAAWQPQQNVASPISTTPTLGISIMGKGIP